MARILVVDDEPSIRDLLHTVLTRRGHEVITAATGRAAVGRFREDRPHVTILDLTLPDVSGFDVLKQIRVIDETASVIVLTGMGTEEHEAKAREFGAIDFLRKGFSLHALGESLKRALPR